MSAYMKSIEPLLAECSKDIRWEFQQLRARIELDEVYRLAEALLQRRPIEWPRALIELQQGTIGKQLLHHLNFHIRKFGYPVEELVFSGPFPALSLRPLLTQADEYRAILRTACCLEFFGNKAWNAALAPVKKSGIPVKLEVGTLALEAFGCSPKHQKEAALNDLAKCIKGHIVNFLWEWETLLIGQTREQLAGCRADAYPVIAEKAV